MATSREPRQTQIVTLAEYFDARAGFRMLRPGSTYRRRPAVLVNPDAAMPRMRMRYRGNPDGQVPREGLAAFDDATIYGGGTIGVADGRVIAESVLFKEGQGPAVLGAKHATKPVSTTFGQAVFAGRYQQSRNYGHFLVEVLPRLMLDVDACPADAPILLHETAEEIAPPMFRAAGLDPARIVWIGRDPVRVETLYWPTPNTLHPLHNSPHIFPCLRTLAESEGGGPPYRRLFVGRRDALTRQLLNDDEIFELLEPWGFERVRPGQMPFEEQVRTFAEADVVVAVCGAALTNMVFMPPGGVVVMLLPSTMPGLFFWDIAHHRDIALSVMWGRIEDPSVRNKNADFRIDARMLADVVAQAAAIRQPRRIGFDHG